MKKIKIVGSILIMSICWAIILSYASSTVHGEKISTFRWILTSFITIVWTIWSYKFLKRDSL